MFDRKVVVIYIVFAKIFHTLTVSDQLCIHGLSWKITDNTLIDILIVFNSGFGRNIYSKRYSHAYKTMVKYV